MHTTATIVRTNVSFLTLAAWAGIAGGVAMLVLGIPLAPYQNEDAAAFSTIQVFNALQHVLLIVAMLGVARSGASGCGVGTLIGTRLALLGLVSVTVAELVAISDPDLADRFYAVATLALTVGLVSAGVAVRRAGVWRGWQRNTLLATGLNVPLAVAPGLLLPWLWPHIVIGCWGICWLLVGLALREPAQG
jgi:hypothetical protein